MPPCITQLFRFIRRPRPASRALTRLTDLGSVRAAMLQAVDDCASLPARHLQLKIRSARTHRDLWMLRSDAYHLIAMNHCQSIANQRIHLLLPLFEGWVPPQELSRVP